MSKVICVYEYQCQYAFGKDAADAYENFKSDIDPNIDIDNLGFFELGREIKVELKLVEIPVEKLPK